MKALGSLHSSALFKLFGGAPGRAALLDAGIDALTRIALTPAALSVLGQIYWKAPILVAGLGLANATTQQGADAAKDLFMAAYTDELAGCEVFLMWTSLIIMPRSSDAAMARALARFDRFNDATRWCPGLDMLHTAASVMHRVVEWSMYRFQGGRGRMPYELCPDAFATMLNAISVSCCPAACSVWSCLYPVVHPAPPPPPPPPAAGGQLVRRV